MNILKARSDTTCPIPERALYRVDGLIHSDSASFVNSFYWTGALGAASVVANVIIILIIFLTNPQADFLSFMIFLPFGIILLGLILLLLWLLTQLGLSFVSLFDSSDTTFTALNRGFTNYLIPLLKLAIFVAIFVTGLSLTFSAWEAPFASIQYFSCN